jgi:hypothetical protein
MSLMVKAVHLINVTGDSSTHGVSRGQSEGVVAGVKADDVSLPLLSCRMPFSSQKGLLRGFPQYPLANAWRGIRGLGFSTCALANKKILVSSSLTAGHAARRDDAWRLR